MHDLDKLNKCAINDPVSVAQFCEIATNRIQHVRWNSPDRKTRYEIWPNRSIIIWRETEIYFSLKIENFIWQIESVQKYITQLIYQMNLAVPNIEELERIASIFPHMELEMVNNGHLLILSHGHIKDMYIKGDHVVIESLPVDMPYCQKLKHARCHNFFRLLFDG